VLEASHGLPGGDEGAAPALRFSVKLSVPKWRGAGASSPSPGWLTMPIERLLLLGAPEASAFLAGPGQCLDPCQPAWALQHVALEGPRKPSSAATAVVLAATTS